MTWVGTVPIQDDPHSHSITRQTLPGPSEFTRDYVGSPEPPALQHLKDLHLFLLLSGYLHHPKSAELLSSTIQKYEEVDTAGTAHN